LKVLFGYPHELWTTRLLARHAREQGPAEGHPCLANTKMAVARVAAPDWNYGDSALNSRFKFDYSTRHRLFGSSGFNPRLHNLRYDAAKAKRLN
jgi:hypothetical protein